MSRIIWTLVVVALVTSTAYAQKLTILGKKTPELNAAASHVSKSHAMCQEDGKEPIHCLVCDLSNGLHPDHHETLKKHIEGNGHVVLTSSDSETTVKLLGIGMKTHTLAVKSLHGGRYLQIMAIPHPEDEKLHSELALKLQREVTESIGIQKTNEKQKPARIDQDSIARFLSGRQMAPTSEPMASLDPIPSPQRFGATSLVYFQGSEQEERDAEKANDSDQYNNQHVRYSIYLPSKKWGLDNPQRLETWGLYDVEIYVTSKPEVAKWVKLHAREVAFASALSFDSADSKGWLNAIMQCSCSTNLPVASGVWHRVDYAPKQTAKSQSATYDTGYTFTAGGGADSGGPGVDMAFTYNTGKQDTTTYEEFEIVDNSKPEFNAWTWQYVDIVKDKLAMIDTSGVDPVFKSTVPAAMSHNTTSLKAESLYRGPADDSSTYQVTVAQNCVSVLMRTFREGFTNKVVGQAPQTVGHVGQCEIDLSRVSVPR